MRDLSNVLLDHLKYKWLHFVATVDPVKAIVCFLILLFLFVIYYRGRKWKYARAFIWDIYFTLLIVITLLGRNKITNPDVCLVSINPLSSSQSLQMGVFEVLFNVLLFIPCGVWVGNHKIQILRKVLRIVVISFLIELLQLLFRIGVFEVHDIIWNTVGGSVGILIVVLFSKIFEGKAQR